METLYDTCVASTDTVTDGDVVNCVSTNLQAGIDVFFTLYSMSLVFLMQVGFAMLCAGCVRTKNVMNSMLKNVMDACGAAIGYWSVGYAFSFGGSTIGGPTTFIGTSNFFLMNIHDDFFLAPLVNPEVFWLYQLAFAATAATIVAGTLAERCQMAAYIGYSVLLTGFVYPVVAHAVWSPNGWLSAYNSSPLFGVGMVDFSGSGVVHVTGGATAIMAAQILGPRRGRFYDNRGNVLSEPEKFLPHSYALQVLGTLILWFGWYGFNPGATFNVSTVKYADIVAHSAVTTTLSAAAGGMSAMLTHLIITERMTGEAVFDLTYTLNGALSGLVAITAGSSVVESWAAVLIGVFAGWIYLFASKILIKLRIDDAVDAIPVHFANGIWGLINAGLFATPQLMDTVYGNSKHVGWFYEWSRGSADARLLAVQLIGALFIIGWILLLMFPFFFGLNYMGLFRADSLEEVVGLDISYHGGKAVAGEENLEYVEAMKVHRSLSETKQRRTSGEQTTADTVNSMLAASGQPMVESVPVGGARSKHMSEIISDMLGATSEIEQSEYDSEVESELESRVDTDGRSTRTSDAPARLSASLHGVGEGPHSLDISSHGAGLELDYDFLSKL